MLQKSNDIQRLDLGTLYLAWVFWTLGDVLWYVSLFIFCYAPVSSYYPSKFFTSTRPLLNHPNLIQPLRHCYIHVLIPHRPRRITPSLP